LGLRDRWDVALYTHIHKLNVRKPVLWTGDLNVAHLQWDVYDGQTNKQRKKSAGFTDQERGAFDKLMKSGFTDLYRALHPDTREDAMTFWSWRFKMKTTNRGWRLDYFIASPSLAPLAQSVEIRKHVDASDHAPLVLSLNSP